MYMISLQKHYMLGLYLLSGMFGSSKMYLKKQIRRFGSSYHTHIFITRKQKDDQMLVITHFYLAYFTKANIVNFSSFSMRSKSVCSILVNCRYCYSFTYCPYEPASFKPCISLLLFFSKFSAVRT